MKTVVTVLAALGLLGLGAFAANWYQPAPPVPVTTSTQPLFQPMERFTISVSNEGHARYLVLDLTLSTYDPAVLPVLNNAAPLLNNALVEHFSNTPHEQVRADFADIPQVQQVLLARFNEALTNNRFEQQIDQVLVTSVYIQ